MARDVTFYVNGPARLLMSCVIAEEVFPGRRIDLILLDQYGYDYRVLLEHVAARFDRIFRLTLPTRPYGPVDQLVGTYLRRFAELRSFFRADSHLILFGIRSPIQKRLIRWAKAGGAPVDVYAESVAVDRYFTARPSAAPIQALARAVFPRALQFQHDYDRFHVLAPEIYAHSAHYPKLTQMFDLYGSPAFLRYSALLTAHLDISEIADYETVLLGQPLSNFDEVLSQANEERMLAEIVGDARALVLPHPNEILSPGRDKYRRLPNARVFAGGVPSELLLHALKPARTLTYSSTAAVNYAAMNKCSRNYFFPVHRSHYDMLRRYQLSLPNIEVSDRFIIADNAYA